MIDQSKTLLGFLVVFVFLFFFLKPVCKKNPPRYTEEKCAACPGTGPASTAGAAGGARTLPVVPHPGQAQAELGGYFSLSSHASSQPRVYMVKSKIPGRQGLARGERRCCLYPAAVITPPNLESSGRAVPSATIRRLFNCSAIANCFPLPGSSCQHPAEGGSHTANPGTPAPRRSGILRASLRR